APPTASLLAVAFVKRQPPYHRSTGLPIRRSDDPPIHLRSQLYVLLGAAKLENGELPSKTMTAGEVLPSLAAMCKHLAALSKLIWLPPSSPAFQLHIKKI
ncbi:hypothetical protein M5D96_008462, partial [Drosophila gunungcola]